MEKIDKIRADETATVTDKVLEDIGIDAIKAPPLPLLLNLIREVGEENGIKLTEHEVNYIAKTNIGWVFKDINPKLAAKGAEIRRSKQQ